MKKRRLCLHIPFLTSRAFPRSSVPSGTLAAAATAAAGRAAAPAMAGTRIYLE